MSADPKLEALIARMAAADFGRGGADELDALEDYLTAHPEQAEQHLTIMALWDELGELEEPMPLTAPEPVRRWRIEWHRVAAAILPLFAVIGVLMFTLDYRGSADRLELQTGPGERRIVTLADGSSVSLSPSSLVQVRLGGNDRELTLAAGEAMFDVAHDPARPFTVAAGNGEVRAIGTAFNIRLAGPEVVVTVMEGTISVTTGEDKQKARGAAEPRLVQLAKAGEQVTYGGKPAAREALAADSFITPARPVDVDRYTGWSKGLLRFDGEPLSVVIEEVNRYALEQVELQDPSLGRMPIYGVLHVGDTEGLVSIVQDSQRLSDAALQSKIRIVPRQIQ